MAKRKGDKTFLEPTIKRARNRTSTSQPPDSSTPEQPFRLLDLPPELRDMIYASIIEIDVPARLDRRSNGKLTIISTIAQTNKQIRSELISASHLHAPIVATVRNLDFRHIVTFFNKLSDLELKHLPSTNNGHRNAARKMTITLLFSPDYAKGSFTGAYLSRWLTRTENLTKKGARVDFSYRTHTKVGLLRMWAKRHYKSGFGLSRKHGEMKAGRPKEELGKILAAVSETLK